MNKTIVMNVFGNNRHKNEKVISTQISITEIC